MEIKIRLNAIRALIVRTCNLSIIFFVTIPCHSHRQRLLPLLLLIKF